MPEDSTLSVEIVEPNSMRALYEEALAESKTSTREEVKQLIANRIKEISRLEILLNKAKADLNKLMSMDIDQVAMLKYKSDDELHIRSTGMLPRGQF